MLLRLRLLHPAIAILGVAYLVWAAATMLPPAPEGDVTPHRHRGLDRVGLPAVEQPDPDPGGGSGKEAPDRGDV